MVFSLSRSQPAVKRLIAWNFRHADSPSAARILSCFATTYSQSPKQALTSDGQSKKSELVPWRLLLASLLGAASGVTVASCLQPARCEAERASSGQTKGHAPPSTTYTKEEISQHNSMDRRVWVTYKDGVYDVTEFVQQHPGGASRLLLAAGGALDPFWNMYKQHQTQEVKALLEGYRIGNLEGGVDMSKQVEDPYANEPTRHPALIIRTDKPMNAETPPDVLTSAITPTELFYVRNHLPVPHVDASVYSLRVEGEGLRTLELSLKDLQHGFKKHTVVATLQCSGNRRHELAQIRPIKGLDWEAGAIGTAEFSGARLTDVLKHAGLDQETLQDIEHVQFEGLDSDITGTCYGASIPAEKAVSRASEVILAYEMNGRPLTADHGFPVRVVVPGVTGARSVKWLSRIVTSREESLSHWQQKDYKSFSPSVDWDTVDWSSTPAIQETNVQSAICSPREGEALEGPLQSIDVSGYAFSGGGRSIIRVDVSADRGRTWTTADLQPADEHSKRGWAWTLWNAELPLHPDVQHGGGEVEIWCKATDDAYNSQPDEPASIWNLRGVLNNAVHHVKVQLNN